MNEFEPVTEREYSNLQRPILCYLMRMNCGGGGFDPLPTNQLVRNPSQLNNEKQ